MKVKTDTYDWIDKPSIVVFSIHSRFSVGDRGYEQVKALMHFVSFHARHDVTILLAEMAHINTFALFYANVDKAFGDVRSEQ